MEGRRERKRKREKLYCVRCFLDPLFYFNLFIHTCIYLEASSHYVTQASLKLTTLPQPPMCGDCEPTCHTWLLTVSGLTPTSPQLPQSFFPVPPSGYRVVVPGYALTTPGNKCRAPLCFFPARGQLPSLPHHAWREQRQREGRRATPGCLASSLAASQSLPGCAAACLAPAPPFLGIADHVHIRFTQRNPPPHSSGVKERPLTTLS